MPDMMVCFTDGVLRGDVDSSTVHKVLDHPESIVWLDISDPDDKDIALMRDSFHFHPLSIEDATKESQRPKIDAYKGYYFAVFYAVSYVENQDAKNDANAEEHEIKIQPLHLFIGKNYIVSVHRGEFQQVQETIKRWRAPDTPLGNSVGSLLYTLLDAMVDDYFPVMDHVADRIDDLEDRIFEKFDEDAIQSIFRLKRDLLNMRRAIAPERDVLNVLLRREIPVFHTEDIIYLQDVYDHLIRVSDSVDTYRDLLSSALDSFLSLQSNRLNQIVKVLTITSIVLMCDALIAGIYGMNFEFMPELHWHYGYFYALGLMLIISVGLVLGFRKLKWL